MKSIHLAAVVCFITVFSCPTHSAPNGEISGSSADNPATNPNQLTDCFYSSFVYCWIYGEPLYRVSKVGLTKERIFEIGTIALNLLTSKSG